MITQKNSKNNFRVQHNRIRSTSILSSVADLIRVYVEFTKYEVSLRVWIDAFKLVYALINQKIQENEELFIRIEICKYI